VSLLKGFVGDLLELTVIKANPRCGHVLVDDVIGAIKYDQGHTNTLALAHIHTLACMPNKQNTLCYMLLYYLSHTLVQY